MSPASLFDFASALAPAGWCVLLASPWLPERLRGVAVLVVPLALSALYVAIMLVHWHRAPGGFESLEAVATLFTAPAMVAAGWVHFLAFDLLVGAWITTTARRDATGGRHRDPRVRTDAVAGAGGPARTRSGADGSGARGAGRHGAARAGTGHRYAHARRCRRVVQAAEVPSLAGPLRTDPCLLRRLDIAHFFATHALHALPLLGWLLATRVSVRRGRWMVAFAALAYTALVAQTFIQALAGQPFLPAI